MSASRPRSATRRTSTSRQQRRGRVPRSRFDVFLNVPFDREYEPLLLVLVAALTAFGLTPRCVLEVPPQQDRLRRLFDLMRECDASIHDLSRCGVYGTTSRCPLFNMPFELGLAVAQHLTENRHAWIVLEAKQYRVQKSLSDLNGFDPLIHEGHADGVLRAVANAFDRSGRNPTMPQLRHTYDTLRSAARILKRQEGTQSLFSRRHFGQLVIAAQESAVRLGLVEM